MRIMSLKELGKGAWKVNESTPIPSKKAPKAKTALAKQIAKLGAENSGPHGKLWNRVLLEFGDEAKFELENVVPGRNFRIDIAMPKYRLAIEVDGWEFHGKYLDGFHKDRERQNLLTENNWRILRFTAKEIYQNIEGCMQSIHRTLKSSAQFNNNEIH